MTAHKTWSARVAKPNYEDLFTLVRNARFEYKSYATNRIVKMGASAFELEITFTSEQDAIMFALKS